MKRIFKNHKAQAALEYLVTYGWAFLVILAAIAALSYFGVLSPKNYMPEKCDFGQQLNCVDQYVDTSGAVVLRFKNDFGANITITNAYGDYVNSSSSIVNISRGEIKKVSFNINKTVKIQNKERFRFIIEFKRQGGSIKHNISGTVFTEVSEPLI